MVSVMLAISSILIGFAAFGRPALLVRRERATGESGLSGVTVVIPARNEAASIGNLLTDLSVARPTGLRVIVVDDHSTDATAVIASGFDFVEVIAAPDLPAGWCGKNWACHNGAAAAADAGTPADHDVLVFLDADVRVAPGALVALVDERARAGGVVSVQPFHEVPTATEQLSGLFNLVSMMATSAGTDHPTAVFGPVICCTVADYEAIGGHASVRGEVVEDLAIAQRFRDQGTPLRVLTGGDLIAFRMYPTGLRALIEGWTKNMATGAASVPRRRSLAVAWWITGLISAALLPVGLTGSGDVAFPALLAIYLAAALGLGVLLGRVGSYRWWASALFPVLVAFFVAVFMRSVWRSTFRRSVTWRDRTIDLRTGTALETGPR